MKQEIESIIQNTLRNYLLQERGELNITQERMSENLAITPRGLAGIEIGEHGCSAVTAIMFLLNTKHREEFFEELQRLLSNMIEIKTFKML